MLCDTEHSDGVRRGTASTIKTTMRHLPLSDIAAESFDRAFKSRKLGWPPFKAPRFVVRLVGGKIAFRLPPIVSNKRIKKAVLQACGALNLRNFETQLKTDCRCNGIVTLSLEFHPRDFGDPAPGWAGVSPLHWRMLPWRHLTVTPGLQKIFFLSTLLSRHVVVSSLFKIPTVWRGELPHRECFLRRRKTEAWLAIFFISSFILTMTAFHI